MRAATLSSRLRGLDVVDRLEGAQAAGRVRGAVERLLALVQARGQELALDAVGVPPQLLLPVAGKTRNGIRELLEGVLAGASLVEHVVHHSFLRDVSLRLPRPGGRVKVKALQLAWVGAASAVRPRMETMSTRAAWADEFSQSRSSLGRIIAASPAPRTWRSGPRVSSTSPSRTKANSSRGDEVGGRGSPLRTAILREGILNY